jgi:signal transduction histidine kinase
MTRAVEAFGLDIDQPPLDDTGPVEVQRAIRAFNTMQERIRGFMAERTQILAAVTHDLKTPMTRMRLRLEHCQDAELKQKLLADLAVMQSLTDEGLELARSMSSGQPLAILDLGALSQSLCDDLADAGQPVMHSEAPAGLLVRAHPPTLRRVLENIIGNAVTYGESAAVSLSRQGNRACIEVRDQGPGIPEDQLANVLKPFVRLETSRSRETGGTGLGLAIAANLLKSQHGDMALDNPPDGGLRVRITLPLAREV